MKVSATKDFSPLDILAINDVSISKKPADVVVSRYVRIREFHIEFFGGENDERRELLKLAHLQSQESRSDTYGKRRDRTLWPKGAVLELVLYVISAEAVVANGKFPVSQQLVEIVKVMAMLDARSQIREFRLDAIHEKLRSLDVSEGSMGHQLCATVQIFLMNRLTQANPHSSPLLALLAYAPEYVRNQFVRDIVKYVP